MHELSGVATMAKRPQTACVERVLKAQPGDSPVDIHHSYVGKRKAREYGAKADTLADWVEYWLPDGWPQMMVGIVPRTDGGTTIVSTINWMGPGLPPSRVGAIDRRQGVIERALANQCGMDFSHARRERIGKDVKAYFRQARAR